MVKSFQFASLPRIIFRTVSLGNLASLVRSFGKNVILVTGKNSFINSDKGAFLFDEFQKAGINFSTVVIGGEPSPDDIDQNVRILSSSESDVVVGIGGGSVLDAGKAISAMMYKTESVSDYLEGVGTKSHPGTKLPYIAVPTTSGTGSEATKNAVISRIGPYGFKRSLRHDNFVPDIALVDPLLTISCSPEITAASGMDCFTQLTEAYLSAAGGPFTDALATEGLKSIRSSLMRSYADGQDIEARSGMSFAALTSGICLANAGLGVVHGFASSVGGRYNIHHGVICGTLMAVANEATVRKLRTTDPDSATLKKYATLGELFTGFRDKSNDYLVDAFIEYVWKLTDDLKLPGLRKLGIRDTELKDIASDTDCKNNPVKFEYGELLEILRSRFI